MSQNLSQNPYQFLKVDDFFSGYEQWETLTAATGHSYDPASRTVAVTFTRTDGAPCALLLTVVQRDAFRVRFSPARPGPGPPIIPSTTPGRSSWTPWPNWPRHCGPPTRSASPSPRQTEASRC